MKGTVWFDGACLGNPGPMGAGAVVQIGSIRQDLSVPMGRGTNNEAEYHGLLLGLRQALAAGVDDVLVHGDSQLVIRQLKGEYAVKAENLRPLFADAKAVLARFKVVHLEWVPREENGAADALSMKAARAR